MTRLTHVDENGHAKMVDVSMKQISHRTARAVGSIMLNHHTIELINQNQIQKGDVLTVAKIAGIQAAKKTHELIPLCHNITLGNINLDFDSNDEKITVISTVVSRGQTGVEMEALTAVCVALLTIYDMCKAVDSKMSFVDVHLLEKTKQPV